MVLMIGSNYSKLTIFLSDGQIPYWNGHGNEFPNNIYYGEQVKRLVCLRG